MKRKKIPLLLELFLTFFKIGLFTFGGGYAMIPLIEQETTDRRNWIKKTEIFDLLAISESTPGPIAINAATYIGFRTKGILGGIIASIGLTLPSFIIIFLISLCYKEIMTWPVFIAMFKGVKVAVILLLILAITKLYKLVDKNKITITIFLITLIGVTLLSVFSIDIPFLSVIFITLGIVTGIVIEIISKQKEVKRK